MDEREMQYPPPIKTETQSTIEAERNTAAIDVLFSEQPKKRKVLAPLTSRLRGPEPDAYAEIAFFAYMEKLRVLREKSYAQIFGLSVNGGTKFNWNNIRDDPVLLALNDLSVSMGGGKGRKEGVELGKSNPPTPQKSRWSLRRER